MLYIVGGMIGVVFVANLVGAMRNKRLRAAWIASNGFREAQWAEVLPPESTKGADLFDLHAWRGGEYRPQISALIAGDGVALFDLTYAGGRHAATVVGFRVPRAAPDFTAGRDATAGQRAALVIGAGVKLEFQGAVKPPVPFDSPLTVRSADAEGVRRVVTREALDLLLALRGTLDKGGEWLFYYRDRFVMPPAGYGKLLDEAMRVRGLLKL